MTKASKLKSLRVATCQFAVEPDIAHNRRWVLDQITEAADGGADVAHFSECALSGYAGVDVAGTADIDWSALRAATQDIAKAAQRAKLWLVLGSTHWLDDDTKPHNCLYVINPQGRIADRYDKRFCTGQSGKQPTLDLCHYSPGNRSVTFKIRGITCGVAICYDYRFPELYRDLKRAGAQIVFHSYHNARKTVVDDPKYNIWKTIVPATMQCRAAENHLWISANNSTARPSMWASFAVRPDGLITGQLKQHRPGVLLTDMTLDPSFFDAPGLWRERAMNAVLHSGELVDHPRSRDLTCY